MTPWPQAIASFYLSATVLLLLLLNNLRELGTDSASPGIVVVCVLGLIVGLVLTVVRITAYARAARRPEVVRRRGPLSEPVDQQRAVTWAAAGAAGLVILVLADWLIQDRTIRLTVFVVGVVLAGLAYWRLWRTPLRPLIPAGTGGDRQGTQSES